MDFFTTHASPILVNIDGKAYQVPRFLNPALKEWSAIVRQQQRDEATAHLGPDDKARILRYFPDPPMDIAAMLQRARSPEGADYVVETQLAKAGVPEDVRKAVLEKSDPIMLRDLADELTLSGQTTKKLGQDEEAEKADPKSPSPAESGGSPETGTKTEPDSTLSSVT